MRQSNKVKNRKEFLINLIQGGLIASLIFGMPIKKLWAMMKNPKIYFKENPESVKRQK
ncbi:MAG: hypothetical protein ACK4G1_06725 [Ignavibacteria bacterium]